MKRESSAVTPLRSIRKEAVIVSTVKSTGAACVVRAGALACTAIQTAQGVEPRATSPGGWECVVSSQAKARRTLRQQSAAQ